MADAALATLKKDVEIAQQAPVTPDDEASEPVYVGVRSSGSSESSQKPLHR